jgi:hypothetical protein
MVRDLSATELGQRLAHVRWIGGGTGSGKSTVAAVLAAQFGADVYDRDRGERGYVTRVGPDEQPRYAALLAMSAEQRWLDRKPEQIFAEMPSLHGESFPLVLDDLLRYPGGHVLLVDDFRTLPREVAPLLSWSSQAVFLLPVPSFREQALQARYADPDRARANWGEADPRRMLAARLARDQLWDAEIRRQAEDHGLPVIEVDGTRGPDQVARQVARAFRLS